MMSSSVYECFRPLTGIWFWNRNRRHPQRSDPWFPSPYGDMVLKYVTSKWEKPEYESFRPLTGIWFWNSLPWHLWHALGRVSVPLRGYGFEIDNAHIVRWALSLFPSPYGDMVLKLTWWCWFRWRWCVSVPLRGYGFEIRMRVISRGIR